MSYEICSGQSADEVRKAPCLAVKSETPNVLLADERQAFLTRGACVCSDRALRAVYHSAVRSQLTMQRFVIWTENGGGLWLVVQPSGLVHYWTDKKRAATTFANQTDAEQYVLNHGLWEYGAEVE